MEDGPADQPAAGGQTPSAKALTHRTIPVMDIGHKYGLLSAGADLHQMPRGFTGNPVAASD
jgi:hypothetical protein